MLRSTYYYNEARNNTKGALVRQAAEGDERGTSVLEILATLSLVAIIGGMVASNVKSLESPIANAGFQVSHYLRLVRSRAISQTLSITVSATSPTQLTASSTTECGETGGASITDLAFSLPRKTMLATTGWSVCFNQRGLADQNINFELIDTSGKRKTVEIALGGGVQIS